jgi:virulence factor
MQEGGGIQVKIGIVGIGDIARKAYLPVIATRPDVQPLICTRNKAVLEEVGNQYRVPVNCRFQTVESLLTAGGIDAAFVHAATEAHYAILRQLLSAGIHVYVDKPIDYSLANSKQLMELAKQKNCALMVGFNRRFAPAYRNIAAQVHPDLVLMQKNRVGLAAPVRNVILDDFIHVVDTLRFFCPNPVKDMQVRWKMDGKNLAYVVVELCGSRYTAIGMMNRESGITEEVLEVIGIGQKWKVTDVRDTVYYHDGEHKTKMGDWVSVGVARGFDAIVGDFLSLVKEGSVTDFVSIASENLKTHELCEQIVQRIESGL